ncbi:ABC-F family ATP-binding cassette domain-containing protein [Candidatus Avelusimicrobium faecicola]|uniref:ABC-F family ATP-binding cassette domain-containing protein n=1 Tax=Candidatus Avelusimicrobium faecicola TaxID=3416205 RepID=UPI00206E4C3B|nr:ABC-F family ATP-binding cassette domain-containing protein [Spirochaetota bacterium]MDY2939635.1 ABC-F family ATP-binding cassette domain-containing protein [Elusimicrobiaceae bacterium]DAG75366.1 MAG TPA: STRUCTURAL MAINTENANCE OF CHROMOSOME 1 [Caudoviricetes sp.]
MIEIKDLSFHFGLRTLFEDASVLIQDGQKVGLVGPNGCGKSTLFKLITGAFSPDGGKIEITRGTQIATVAQEIADPSQPLLPYVLAADKELTALEKESQRADISGERLAEVFDRMEFLGAHSATARASAILSGLGFENKDFHRPLKEFSGGWQVRACLAAALYAPSNCLLLDEPTNHLDLETSVWLENYLLHLNKTVFIISHDRHILNLLCDKIIHVENAVLKLYNGNYDQYERTRAAAIEGMRLAAAKHERVVAHLQSFVDRFRYKATKAKQAQSRIKMIEKMGELPPIPKDPEVHFQFPSPTRLTQSLISIEGGVAGYDEKPVLTDLNLRIEQDDRIALLGANGNGKSTLAKILSHRLLLMSGKMTTAKKMKIAYFSQHQTEELDVEKTPFEQLGDVMPGASETQIRAQLGAFGLNKAKSDTEIGKLSGGEKSRLLLALITKDAPHLLILDEPTNHLDIQSRDALLDALNAYTGAVVLITHDLHVIEMACDTLWIVRGGTCRTFTGDLEDYKMQLLNGGDREGAASDKMSGKEARRRDAAKRRADAAPLKKQIRELDKRMEKLSTRKAQLEQQLLVQYSADGSIELALLTDELNKCEEEWLALNEQCEALLHAD